MTRPHPRLLELAQGHAVGAIDDHDELLRSAADHGMTGLLWSALRDIEVPIGFRRELAARDLVIRRRHQELWAELGRVTSLLGERGIAVATIKGVTAEARWYDRVGDRPCSDVDLLVAPDQTDRVGELIDAVQPEHPLAHHARSLVSSGRIQSVELMSNGIPVDVHLDPWKLWIPSRAATEVWAGASDLRLDIGDMRILSPAASIVQLILHMNKDRFRRLLGFVDIARIVERDEVDWDEVERLAWLDGLAEEVALGLDVVARVTGTAVVSKRPTGARATLWSFAWRPAVRLQGASSEERYRWRQYLIAILARGRTCEGVRSLVRRVLPSSALVRYRHRNEPGPYLWRLTSGRVRALVARRRRTSRAAPPPS